MMRDGGEPILATPLPQSTDQIIITTSQNVGLQEVANKTKGLATSMEASIVQALRAFYNWGPVVTTLEWINTNVTQYDGVFRHKQALDATFADLKAKVRKILAKSPALVSQIELFLHRRQDSER